MKKLRFLLISLSVLLLCAGPMQAGAVYEISEAGTTHSEILYLTYLGDDTQGESAGEPPVIFSQNAEQRAEPASLTKIMTAIVTLEYCESNGIDIAKQTVTARQEIIDLLAATGSQIADIKGGTELTVLQLLQCMLIHSGNDAANVLADYVGEGSIAAFVEKMNAKAAELGCAGTHFVNAHGLSSPEHYTTARDLAVMARYAMRTFPIFRETVKTATYTLPTSGAEISNTNQMLINWRYYYNENVTGVKTGSTDSAGLCVIASADKGGYSYLAVVLKGLIYTDTDGIDKQSQFVDANSMLNWALNNLRWQEIANSSILVNKEIPVEYSRETDHIQLVPKESVKALVPANIDVSSVSIEPIAGSLPESLKAPVKKGDVLGKAVVKYGSAELATVDLVAGNDAGRSIPLYIGHLMKVLFSSVIFKVLLVLAGLFLLFYIVVNIIYNYQRKKRRKLHLVKGGTPAPEYRKRYKKRK